MALRFAKGLAALGGVLLLLAGCGGGGESPQAQASVPAAAPATATPATPTADTAAAAPTAPAAPQGFAVSYQARAYAFQWDPAPGATSYELFEDPDGAGPQPEAQVGGALALTSHTLHHGLILHQRINAQYRVRACNSIGCGDPAAPVQPDVARAVGYFKASNNGADDRFGGAVALSADGTTLAVTAIGEDSNATYLGGSEADDSAPDSGAVYVFLRGAQGWVQQHYVKGSGMAGERFGSALALSADGTRLAVGVPGAGGGRGMVMLYERGTDNIWWRSSMLQGRDVGDNFGSSVAISGDGLTLAIGAPDEDSGVLSSEADNSRASAGAVYVWLRVTATAWQRMAYVQAEVPWASNRFGAAVALSSDGSTLAVGTPGDSCPCAGIDAFHAGTTAPGSGSVYVLARGSSWTHQAYLKAGHVSTGAAFGTSLSLSADGNTLAVGAPYDGTDARGINGTVTGYWSTTRDSGAAFVFARSGTAWSQQAFIKPTAVFPQGVLLGSSVSLSADGNMLAVGMPRDNSWASGFGGGELQQNGEAGGVYLFGRGAGAWSLGVYVKPTNNRGALGSHFMFGQSVAIAADGSVLAVGAPHEGSTSVGIQGEQNTAGTSSRSGAVYLY